MELTFRIEFEPTRGSGAHLTFVGRIIPDPLIAGVAVDDDGNDVLVTHDGEHVRVARVRLGVRP